MQLELEGRVSTPLGDGVVRNVVRAGGVVTTVLVELDTDRGRQPLWRSFEADACRLLSPSAAVGDLAVTEPPDAPDMAAPGALPLAIPSGVAPGEPVRPPKTSTPTGGQT